MATIHTLSRIVATGTEAVCFIWSDGYAETHVPGWTGWVRGVTAGHGPDGEWGRYDGTSPLDDADQVLAVFLAKGGVVEPAPADTADNITSAPDTLFGGPTLKEIFDGH